MGLRIAAKQSERQVLAFKVELAEDAARGLPHNWEAALMVVREAIEENRDINPETMEKWIKGE